MTTSIINAHPFIVSNFGEPAIMANAGEYTAVCNTAKSVFLFRCTKIIASIPNAVNKTVQSRVSTQISIRLFSSPILIATNGSPQVVLFVDKSFYCVRIPIFTMAKFCAILGPKIFIVADSHSAYYWHLEQKKCQLCFTSDKEILALEHHQKKTFIFTTHSFEIISQNESALSLPMNFPTQARFCHSIDYSKFYVLSGLELTPLYISDQMDINRKQPIILPTRPLDFIVFDDSILALFNAKDGKKRFVRKYSLRTNDWSSPVDVPLVSTLTGCGRYGLAACPQYALALHNIPEIFDKIAENQPMIQVLQNFDNESNFPVITLFYGLDALLSELQSHNVSSKVLVELVLDELWSREMFDEWGLIALEYPKYLKSQHSSDRIVELMKTRKFEEGSNIRFATILEASGDYWNAFIVYLKAYQIESVEAILQHVVTRIDPYLSDLIECCMIAIKSGRKEAAGNILKTLAQNPSVAKPEKIIPHLMFAWELLEMYYSGFSDPPQEVVDAYLNGLAIYQPKMLRDFLITNKKYDVSRACDSLLKLGCIDEYGYVLSRTNTKKFLEFLVIREDWDSLFKYLEKNKKEWPFVLEMLVFDKTYFVEFIRHFEMLGISMSELLSEIPKECEPQLLSDGFKYLASVIASRNESEEIVEGICAKESFHMFEELVLTRNAEMVIEFS
ncbi:hypothetical protein TRFO_22691 [Tritrichomonas foetus]|uniref:Uncharacterized protein n=1 Tax=Tritrichomonas foetus TaxID=1144522 RepID=A0A1J4KBH7_9EUKA|nr:hypothetical protein TRFO_22691 [Tritrichomonas foetus]|eukprot:OHT08769.1 hypothetical protein TRFO_22691 [Tritrichomonas foetus]